MNHCLKVMVKKFQRIVEANILGLHSKQGQIVQERMWKVSVDWDRALI